MKLLRFVPLLLVLGCADQSGPQPRVLSESPGRSEIVLSWPEGVTVGRVNQLARATCSVGGRRTIGLRTETINGERVRIYRCEERLRLAP